ncbi:MAG: methionine adenosyltransferase [Candidatus Kerfeldbacteria bacterium]|nr:methionine adenosyltransferase [Candidatus Kerfeldbacteria bacterium]
MMIASESVTEGHPDKLCDQISDAILDELLRGDPESHAGIETLATTGLVVVAGEISTRTYVDIPGIARKTIQDIGYTDHHLGFHYEDCGVIVAIDEQSRDIAQGVNEGEGKFKELGAGDQGLMFGYATNETDALMPMPILYCHRLTMKMAEVRKNGTLPYLGPDGKAELAVEYEKGKPGKIHTVVIAAQHSADISEAQVEHDIVEQVVKPVVGEYLSNNTRYFINATGKFIKGGPPADTGLTGRKIIVDTYGGHGSHGGGAFSGKDPTKVDRSASYMARYIAKNIVAAKLAEKCEVQLAYVIGVAEPVSLMINTFGTGVKSPEELEKLVRDIFPLTPKGIIDTLNLRRPIFKKTAAYGHFGRNDPDFTWERTDKIDELRRSSK